MKKPKLCVPLTGGTRQDIDNQLKLIVPKQPDIIEFRADFIENIDNVEYVLSTIDRIINQIEVPLLFTIRSEHEGGEPTSLTEEEKVALIREVCAKSEVTYIDYEVANDEKFVRTVQEAAEQNDKKLILSYHNFHETPDNNNLIKRFVQMEMYGAHIAKVAVMPKVKADVLRLLNLTKDVDQLLSIPVMTMSMGDIGKYSRAMGWVYGSIMTFGVGVQSSAPGQIPIEDLRSAINKTYALIN